MVLMLIIAKEHLLMLQSIGTSIFDIRALKSHQWKKCGPNIECRSTRKLAGRHRYERIKSIQFWEQMVTHIWINGGSRIQRGGLRVVRVKEGDRDQNQLKSLWMQMTSQIHKCNDFREFFVERQDRLLSWQKHCSTTFTLEKPIAFEEIATSLFDLFVKLLVSEFAKKRILGQ